MEDAKRTPQPDVYLTSGSGEAATAAARDVLDERQRQISVEGWTAGHDDEHGDGSMARAAAAYCLCGEGPPAPGVPSEFHSSRPWDFNILRAIWPRSWNWPNPKDRRRNLVRAAALILAEIERLDRAAPPARNGLAEDQQPDKKDSAPVAQVVEPLTLDQRYWVDRRADIIAALEAEGLQILSDKDRVWLHKVITMPNGQSDEANT